MWRIRFGVGTAAWVNMDMRRVSQHRHAPTLALSLFLTQPPIPSCFPLATFPSPFFSSFEDSYHAFITNILPTHLYFIPLLTNNWALNEVLVSISTD